MEQAPMVPINYLAVLVAALIPMAVGALWYLPALFAKKWMALVGKTEEEVKNVNPMKAYGISFLTSLIMAYVLAHSVYFGMSFMHISGFAAGMQGGFWSWLGFVVTTNASSVLFEFRKPGLYWMSVGYYLICLLLMGGVLGAWT
jgi:hypothetical protein